ncbi:M57 family metalloprotease [Sorangium sp. So ce1389]|uniref:M57 family metalloprotease n=1 Tax=Sorangium sp. So ce1389 TaxID=3133336 RepID=UPI003F5D7FF5
MRILSSTNETCVARILAAAALAVVAGCTAPVSEEREVEDVADTSTSFEDFEAQVFREPETGVYIVDGDTPLISRDELRRFYEQVVLKGALAVNVASGADVRWSNTQKMNLTYCVSTAFGGNHAAVVQAMATAASAWQAAADVRFVYRSDQNGACNASNTNVMFDVRPTSGQDYLARAFFPGYPRAYRNILIDSSSFGNIAPYTLAGILRHELGHTLGFRHEHTRVSASPCFEDNGWRGLTPYDSGSVMHYPQCGGTNRGDLVLTASDNAGASSIYGANVALQLDDPRVFDAAFYLQSYGDLAAAFGSDATAARNHWLNAGISEGRRASRAFDARFYLKIHGDLQAAFQTNYAAAIDHWLNQGLRFEGRRGARELDVSYYVSTYGDLQNVFGANLREAVNHWLYQGMPVEGRAGSAEVDVNYYLSVHPDLSAAYSGNRTAALNHFIWNGLSEGRRASVSFNVSSYVNHYSDLKAAFGTDYTAAFDHWIMAGIAEGRTGAP